MGLGGHGALGNARKECHSQQGTLHSPATSRERTIRLKRPHRQGRNILLHDNARPHVVEVVIAVLKELEREVLRHPPYSPDLASMDYCLFRSLSNHMRDVTFDNKEDLKTWLHIFFDTRASDFWRKGIDKVVERWEAVVNSNGEYIIDLFIVITIDFWRDNV